MRIAMIGQKGLPATYGGVERHVEELGAALARMGHEVTVYCRPHYCPAPRPSEHRGMRCRFVPSIPTKHLDAISHAALATLDALFRGYDVVHYHGIGPSLVSPPTRLRARRTVLTVHALDWRRAKWGPFARACLRLGEAVGVRTAGAVIAVSDEIRVHLLHRHRVRSEHIPNGVPPPRRRPLRSLAERFGLAPKGYVLFLGRLVPEKGCHLLIEAFRGLETDLKLLLAGDAPAGSAYVRRLRALFRGDDRVILAGGLYGAAKEEALSHAACLALPSDVEGMPIVLLEAMSYALPVVASDLAPHRRLLKNGAWGRLFRRGDAQDLRAALAATLADLANACAVAERAAQEVLARYDWGRIAERTLRVYEG